MNKYNIIIPALISFGASMALCPIFIPFLRKLKFGQSVRDDGPQSHLSKAGTPTMGGIVILVSIALTSLFYIKSCPEIIPILFTTVGFGLVGLLDDYLKIVFKNSDGLKPWQKMLGQFIVTAVFAFYMYKYTDYGTEMVIPFINKTIDIGWVYYPLLFFVMIGTANGSNFTDGLDGLASSVTVLIATYFTVAAAVLLPNITPVTCAVAGALLGFLVFNVYPARVFMGDTGSLALGGFVASTAYMLKMPLIIVLVALVYLVEVLSVIIQVTSYKLTKKRVFKMAPIHHHFELSGWPETKVVAIFSIVTAILCLIGILAL